MGHLIDRAKARMGRQFWKPEEIGDAIEGEVITIESGYYGKILVLNAEDGREYGIGCSGAVLSKLVEGDTQVHSEDRIALVYKGIPAGKKYKDFEIEIERKSGNGAVPDHIGETEQPGSYPADDDLPF